MLFERVEQRSDTVSLEKLAVAARARYRTRESGAEQRMVINYKDFVAHWPVRMRPEASGSPALLCCCAALIATQS
ncbi:MAG TPA: hypothetical protein VK695_11455 [Steroidobacteraceae bacterium]|jgi:hypothetical protein|nr:hypothetical protein [Steroidobacteraceae bacterium]